MGQSQSTSSYSSLGGSISIEEAEEIVKKSKCKTVKMEWYQIREGLIRHTGLVVVVDGEPVFTIDYGGARSSSSSSSSSTSSCKTSGNGKQGVTSLSKYNEIYNRVGTLAKIKKERLIEFIKTCLNYNLQYNVACQNCRTFVVDVVNGLRNVGAIEIENDKVFCKKMDKIQKEDSHKVSHWLTFKGLFGEKHELQETVAKAQQNPGKNDLNSPPLSFPPDYFIMFQLRH